MRILLSFAVLLACVVGHAQDKGKSRAKSLADKPTEMILSKMLKNARGTVKDAEDFIEAMTPECSSKCPSLAEIEKAKEEIKKSIAGCKGEDTSCLKDKKTRDVVTLRMLDLADWVAKAEDEADGKPAPVPAAPQ